MIDRPRPGPCPVDSAALVRVRYRNGTLDGPVKAGTRRWDRFPGQRAPSPFDIVAYEIVESGKLPRFPKPLPPVAPRARAGSLQPRHKEPK